MRLVVVGRALAAAVLVVGLCAGMLACGGGNRRVAALTAGPGCGGKNDLTAEGSTAQERAVTLFNQAWGQNCPGKRLSYAATASGAGREQFIAGHVDFAVTDAPLVADQIGPAAKRCGGNPAWDLPVVFGPVALVYNLPGVPALVLSSDALAKIFSGRITTWNDPILAALNPGTALPATNIVPVYRSDTSGTTDNLQRYLTAAAPQSWANGIGPDFKGGVGEGAASSEGVVRAVRGMPGSVGYLEKGIADQAGLPYARIGTAGGVIPLTNDTTSKAVKSATFVADGNDLLLDLNPMYTSEQPGAYPLLLAGYDIVCSKGYDTDTTGAIKSFLAVAAGHGQDALSPAGFVPLPDNVRQRLVSAIDAMQ